MDNPVPGLRYVSDDAPGITRRRCGRGFAYYGPDGDLIRDPQERERIEALAVPPAWTDVWICPRPNGHIQATGRDDRGRKQYRYHPRWREVRDRAKYERSVDFARALPKIRRTVRRHLARPGLPKEKVLATAVRIMDLTGVRVGNEEYARDNGTFGLTTLRDRHARFDDDGVRFRYQAKGGKEVTVAVNDVRLARIVQDCQEIPGQELFQYLDEDGDRHAIDSSDVNEYVRSLAGDDFTAKDFRTWSGTVLAACELKAEGPFEGEREGRSKVLSALERVGEALANTPTVCRNCYVHPGIVEGYLDGSLLAAWEEANLQVDGLRKEEAFVLEYLSGGAGGSRAVA